MLNNKSLIIFNSIEKKKPQTQKTVREKKPKEQSHLD